MTAQEKVVVLEGVCHFFSETGTEGGYWAFQDGRYITKNVVQPYCKKCGWYFDYMKENPQPCTEGEHEHAVGDSWSYDGLHILRDGDQLTIFSLDDPTQVVWSGAISLNPRKDFNEHVFGWRVHAKQNGVDMDSWARFFFETHPAELTKNRT